MKKEMPLTEKPSPKNLPANFQPVRWEDWGSSIVCRAHGRLVKFWLADRLVQSMER